LKNKVIPKLLLIDDDDSTIFFHELMIEKLEVTDELFIRNNGQEALDLLRELQEDAPYNMPNLILLDLDMPIMNGYDFMEHYSKLPSSMQQSRIVIVSTSTIYIDQSRIAAFSFIDSVLAKPLKQQDWKDLKNRYGR
jgi:CheY-like chemotaxis protein